MIAKEMLATTNKAGQSPAPAAPSQGTGRKSSPRNRKFRRCFLTSPIPASAPATAHGMIPFSGELKFHHGLDIPAPAGTNVHPVRPGTVLFSGQQRGYGNVVIIDHGDGFTSKYAHNQENLVQEGEKVDSASVIARVGSTGKSTGSHVHFEVAYRGRDVDPGMLLAHR